MKCPTCGRELESLGKKTERLRCVSCRHVYDKHQLARYYEDDVIDERFGQHQYETIHMHQSEKEHKTRPEPVATKPADILAQKMASTPVSTFRPQNIQQSPPATPPSFQPPRQQSPQGTKTARILLIVFLIVFFLGPMLTTCMGMLAMFVTDNTSNTNAANLYYNANKTSNITNKNASHSTNTQSYLATYTDLSGTYLDDANLSVKTSTVEDAYYGTVLVVEYTWTNAGNMSSTGYRSFYSAFEVSASQDEYELLEAFLPDQKGYSNNSAFEQVREGETSIAQWAYKLNSDTKVVDLEVRSRDDMDDYSQVPIACIRVKIGEGGTLEIVEPHAEK